MSLPHRLLRIALVASAMACLITGLWGGLLRLSWNLPALTEHANWISDHGPLMVCGFLGTLIGVERAVALGSAWAYLAPALTASGGIAVMSGVLGFPAPLLFSAGSIALVGVLVAISRRELATATVTMVIGAIALSVGNLLWLFSWPVPRLVFFWVAFPTLTIAAERLELNRFQPPRPGSQRLFVLLTGVFLAALLIRTLEPRMGTGLVGAAAAALGLWLLRYDIAWRTVRQQGLTRFTAVCLLSGYVWLLVAGVLAALYTPIDNGQPYDAALHAVFMGFVFPMIFGHAPIIFPAVLGLAIPYRPRFYAHLILLHAATLTRIAGDLSERAELVRWGGLLGAIAIAAFLLNTVSSALLGVISRRRETSK